jgi:hypothetical protein
LAFVFAGDYTTPETTPRLSRSAPVRDQTIASAEGSPRRHLSHYFSRSEKSPERRAAHSRFVLARDRVRAIPYAVIFAVSHRPIATKK